MSARGESLWSSQVFTERVSGPGHVYGLLDSPVYAISFKRFYSHCIPFLRLFPPMFFGLFIACYDFYPLL